MNIRLENMDYKLSICYSIIEVTNADTQIMNVRLENLDYKL